MRALIHLLGGGYLETTLNVPDAAEVAWLMRHDRVLTARYLSEDGGVRLAIIPIHRIQLISLEDDGHNLCGGEAATGRETDGHRRIAS